MGRNANKGKYQASISILDLTKSPYELLLHVCICLCFQSSAINDYAREQNLSKIILISTVVGRKWFEKLLFNNESNQI